MISRPRRSAGFSLIELLVASAIGLAVIAATYQLVLQASEIVRSQAEVMELERTTRASFAQITRDIRQAGADPTGRAFGAGAPFFPPDDQGPNRIHIRMDLPRERDGRIGEDEIGNGTPDDASPDEDIAYEYCEGPASSPTCPGTADHQIFRTVSVRGETILIEPFADGIDMEGRPVFLLARRAGARDPYAIVVTLRGKSRHADPRSGRWSYFQLSGTVMLRNEP
ncbi:MAG: prepilin-type N-terminal cleavage/methylation domain-containing protein [Acidobacteriota bacterium]